MSEMDAAEPGRVPSNYIGGFAASVLDCKGSYFSALRHIDNVTVLQLVGYADTFAFV